MKEPALAKNLFDKLDASEYHTFPEKGKVKISAKHKHNQSHYPHCLRGRTFMN